jgi:hypothetical protein
MSLGETLVAVWHQVLVDGKGEVELDGKYYHVQSTRSKRLRTVRFDYGPREIDGIEQNPNSGSKWAAMAREGKRVMQFSCAGRYVGNVCDGSLIRYPAWRALELPE